MVIIVGGRERFSGVFEIALVLLGIISATETPYYAEVFGDAVALKFAILPFLIMIIMWMFKELYKRQKPIEFSLLLSEFCWEIWVISLAYYLLFFYLYLTGIPYLAFFVSMLTVLVMFVLIQRAYYLEYRNEIWYYHDLKWKAARAVFVTIGLIFAYAIFLVIPQLPTTTSVFQV